MSGFSQKTVLNAYPVSSNRELFQDIGLGYRVENPDRCLATPTIAWSGHRPGNGRLATFLEIH